MANTNKHNIPYKSGTKEYSRAYARIWREENRDKWNAYQREFRNDEQFREYRRNYEKEYKLNHPEYREKAKLREQTDKYRLSKRNQQLVRDYGITLETYYKILHNQEGICAICAICANPPKEGKILHVDHDHCIEKSPNFSIIRALLCAPCNTALGLFKENLETMENAIAYLRRCKANICLNQQEMVLRQLKHC